MLDSTFNFFWWWGVGADYTKGDTELLSLYAVQARDASNRKKRKKTAYSLVHYQLGSEKENRATWYPHVENH